MDVLDEIAARWPGWNPQIIKHRREKAAEAVQRLEARPGTSPGTRLLRLPPCRPTMIFLSRPRWCRPIRYPIRSRAHPVPSKRAVLPRRRSTSGDPIQEIQTRIEGLQQDLNSARDRLERVAQEKEELTKKYDICCRRKRRTLRNAWTC